MLAKHGGLGMRSLLRSLLAVGLLLPAALAQSCAAITSPAPCGQLSDSEERCLFRGCCFNASAAYPCFYAGGNAVPVTHVHVVQASHFDAGFAYTIQGVLELWWYTVRTHALAPTAGAARQPQRQTSALPRLYSPPARLSPF